MAIVVIQSISQKRLLIMTLVGFGRTVIHGVNCGYQKAEMMKAKAEQIGRVWCVRIVQGTQVFGLDYYPDTKEEAEWMASMFNKALKKHDAYGEKLERDETTLL